MELNVVELVVQAGALGLVVILLFFMSKIFGRMVDCLTLNAENQAKTAGNLDALSDKIVEQGQVALVLAESVRTLALDVKSLTAEVAVEHLEGAATDASVAKLLGKLLHQLETHETRAVTRWEQQSTQSAERHAELMRALRELGNREQEGS